MMGWIITRSTFALVTTPKPSSCWWTGINCWWSKLALWNINRVINNSSIFTTDIFSFPQSDTEEFMLIYRGCILPIQKHLTYIQDAVLIFQDVSYLGSLIMALVRSAEHCYLFYRYRFLHRYCCVTLVNHERWNVNVHTQISFHPSNITQCKETVITFP